MTNIRLNKFLAECGVCSRRHADELIETGNVFVNEKPAVLGMRIDPENDKVRFGNKAITKDQELIYYALYKPKGIITTAEDEEGRETVLNFLPKEPRVFPVGRLDKNSEGLLILTNDGDLTQELTHPKFKHEKEYEVLVKIINKKSGTENPEHFVKNIEKKFLTGLNIDNKSMRVDSIKSTPIQNFRFKITVVIHTGYNRQIRKMCDKMGLEVLKLKRTRVGNLNLSDLDLKPGEYKLIHKLNLISHDSITD